MLFNRKKLTLPAAGEALTGRTHAIPTASAHFLTGRALAGPWPQGCESIAFGMGCFWGAERKFWQLDANIHITAVGYAGGQTPNPTYEEVCTGLTGHNEVVLVVFDPALTPLESLMATFWESHDPTQGMRQGNDVGTQYRSGIYTTTPAQHAAAIASRDAYGHALSRSGYPAITTEIQPLDAFYFAEAYHQQYLAKNPHGYCGLGGTGVQCPL